MTELNTESLDLHHAPIEYDSQGRMKYHPDFHDQQGTPWKKNDLIYLCKYYDIDGNKRMSLALGRTQTTIASKLYQLKKQNLFDYYKRMDYEE